MDKRKLKVLVVNWLYFLKPGKDANKITPGDEEKYSSKYLENAFVKYTKIYGIWEASLAIPNNIFEGLEADKELVDAFRTVLSEGLKNGHPTETMIGVNQKILNEFITEYCDQHKDEFDGVEIIGSKDFIEKFKENPSYFSDIKIDLLFVSKEEAFTPPNMDDAFTESFKWLAEADASVKLQEDVFKSRYDDVMKARIEEVRKLIKRKR